MKIWQEPTVLQSLFKSGWSQPSIAVKLLEGDGEIDKSNGNGDKEGNGDGRKSNGNSDKEGKGGKSDGKGNQEGNGNGIEQWQW